MSPSANIKFRLAPPISPLNALQIEKTEGFINERKQSRQQRRMHKQKKREKEKAKADKPKDGKERRRASA